MGNIERWTIWKADDGGDPAKAYIEGPPAGDWAADGVEVVPASQLRGAVRALEVIADGTYHHEGKRRNYGPATLRKIAADALAAMRGQ